MKFGFCGINYKNAGLDIRDIVNFTDSRKVELFQRLEEKGILQCMVLSTCNRSEVYYFYQNPKLPVIVKKIYQEMFPQIDLKNYLGSMEGENALRHLFFVTAGLDSQILGEDQILGQVKEAFDFSKTMGYSKKELNKTVRDAIACAKKIKTTLKISEIPLSVSYVGIKQLEREYGINGKRVLIIGSGQTAALALRYIYHYGAEKIIICNRTSSHAKELKAEFPNISIENFENRYDILKECDIVISATSAPHLVIKKEKCTISRKMYFLDLAAPRDIDMSFMKVSNCRLVNLDMLQEVIQKNQKDRESLIYQSRKIIEQSVLQTFNWLLTTRVDETIQSLQIKCSEIIEDGFCYINRKIELSEREQKIIKRTLEASFKRLLKEPIEELKKLETVEEQDQYKDTLAKLFQIQGIEKDKKEWNR